MSKSTKRKHVVKEFRSKDFVLPSESQQIVRLREGRGNNLHLAETDDGSDFLISMPSKFRKNVWVKRGDFVIIDVIPEGGKVRGEISTILDASYIKFLKTNDCWPRGFAEQEPPPSPTVNSNRVVFQEDSERSSDSD